MCCDLKNTVRQAGFTFIELIIFIVVVSIGIAGILSVFKVAVRHSADPVVRKQAQSIAASLLAEVSSHPFTYCDPSDSNATVANSVSECATTPEQIGPEPGQTRFISPQFNNVNDYHGYTMNPVVNINNNPVNALQDYQASVVINPVGTTLFGYADPTAVLQINVTVSGPGITLTETAYRFRFAPNAIP